ncbi:BZ3500_MvSof-1268-A1-R1_Chr10-2g02844 [Microbotryum saponariae]|uniref:BZ3500_MvSof-1268-A1-R1_Chr10-2g02844 protein n=1 Tax=Microbotryum saponariae TaxID=289078 RepID=A0A2X0K6L9_9BASI|nr:BZ3501_MvSof-1269-A2-R1_Chr10-2g02430 [Microbotryum saponariae]SDA01614.1 BZ3500_MvSof-1268-A1-R1_Chr10-2g02844 [Microbotryum saponariae]
MEGEGDPNAQVRYQLTQSSALPSESPDLDFDVGCDIIRDRALIVTPLQVCCLFFSLQESFIGFPDTQQLRILHTSE